MRSVVLFPQPLGPTRLTTSPLLTDSERPSTAARSVPGKRRESFSMRTPSVIEEGFYTDEEAISSLKMRALGLLALSLVVAGCSGASGTHNQGPGVGGGGT